MDFVRQSACGRLLADGGRGRRLGSRDDRPAFLASPPALVRAPTGSRPRRCGACPGAVAARHDRSRPAGDRPGGGPRLDRRSLRGHDSAFTGSHRSTRKDHPQSHPGFHWFSGGRAAGAPRSPSLAAPSWSRAYRLPRWPLCRGRPGSQCVRGEPHRWHSSCPCLRRPRPLFNLPHTGARGNWQHRAARSGRAVRAAPHRRHPQYPAGVSIAAARDRRGHTAVAALRTVRGGPDPCRSHPRKRARNRHPVRRHPRLLQRLPKAGSPMRRQAAAPRWPSPS